MMDWFRQLFDTTDFPPRWQCGIWTGQHGWTHIIADLAIFGAYASIPAVLAYFVLRRKDIPFTPVFWLFATFILACGVGHLVEATVFWHPWYRLSAVMKVLTATVSWATVIALIPIVPRALALPGLASTNLRLEEEIEERSAAQQELQRQAQQLQEAYTELELFTKTVVDREDRVIELKQEVNELLQERGRDPRYLAKQSEV